MRKQDIKEYNINELNINSTIHIQNNNNKSLVVFKSGSITIKAQSKLDMVDIQKFKMPLREFIEKHEELHDSLLDGGWSDYARATTHFLSYQKNELLWDRPIYFNNLGLSFYKRNHLIPKYSKFPKNSVFMEDSDWENYIFPLTLDEAIKYIGYLQGKNCINDLEIDCKNDEIQDMIYSKAVLLRTT